jgi:hypothetical protein
VCEIHWGRKGRDGFVKYMRASKRGSDEYVKCMGAGEAETGVRNTWGQERQRRSEALRRVELNGGERESKESYTCCQLEARYEANPRHGRRVWERVLGCVRSAGRGRTSTRIQARRRASSSAQLSLCPPPPPKGRTSFAVSAALRVHSDLHTDGRVHLK